jgi:3-methyladenine DNA glycosylase AlkD
MERIITEIRKQLKKSSDEKTRATSQRFFKEKIKCHGIKTAIVKKISKEYFNLIKNKSKENVFELCEKLWQSGYIEESFVACKWSYFVHKEYEPRDFKIFQKWINTYVSNWASCDTFCNHTMGTFIEMYPESLAKLKEFTASNNRWMRRASAVSLIVPARKGIFLNDIFEIADRLLVDEDDLVQKGYGWMLKVASHSHQQEVFDYVVKQKNIMPRTALRYAIEKMPKEMKRVAMEK